MYIKDNAKNKPKNPLKMKLFANTKIVENTT